MPLNTSSKNSQDESARKLARFVIVEAPRHFAGLAAIIFLLLAAGAAGLGYWMATHRSPALNTATTAKSPSKVAATYAAKSGPWGELLCQRSVIEVPEEYLGLRSWENESLQWIFRGYSPESLKQFLSRLALPAKASQDLADTNNWRIVTDGISISPALETVFALSPSVREQLYAELGRYEENIMQNQPFHWPLEDADELFNGTRATPESIAAFRSLTYSRGKYLLFSDWKALLRALPDVTQRNSVAQALMGRHALFVSVHVDGQTDLEALLRYWGAGGYQKDIRPLLEAAARLPQGMNLSVANFLPPQIRTRLNTFPLTSPDEGLNCHWTTFNFFRTIPEPPNKTRFWREKLKAEYHPVTDTPRYGDVLLLLKPDNTLIHSCIYLADDIVYTKNGGSPFAPWQLMTLADLLEFYSWDLPEHASLKLGWYRKQS